MPRSLTRSLAGLRRRAVVADLVGTASRHALVAGLAAGAAALLLRIGAGLSAGQAALALLPLAATPLSAAWVVRRRQLSPGGAAAWLDVRAGGSGALVTALEVDDPRWRATVDDALARAGDPPAVLWKPSAGRASMGAGFAALALLVPVASPHVPGNPATVQPAIDALREKLATLEEEIEFEAETAAELQERLARLEADAADARNPEATYEALAGLEERLEAEALEAQDAAEKALEELAAAEAGANTDAEQAKTDLQEAFEGLDRAGLLPRDASELSDLLDGLLSELSDQELTDWGERREEGEQVDWGELFDGEAFDPGELAALSEEMRALLAEKMAELADAGLLDMPPVDWGELADFDLSELADLSLAELADLELCEDCKNGEP